MSLEEIGKTSRGYTIFREENEVGGHRYWSDEIGGGVCVLDTSLVDLETLEFCLNHERWVREEGLRRFDSVMARKD
jgi:hypothetical protein